jgi:hypothetical protein
MRIRSREGFALPLVLFVIGVLTVGAAAAFTRVENEARISRDHEASVDAFSLAQGGLEYFTMNRRPLGLTTHPPLAAESARVTLPGGYADVIMSRVRPRTATQEAMHQIRSRGTAIRGATAATPPAVHTVTQFAVYRELDLHVTGAWTSISGLEKNGTAGTISGEDHCYNPPTPAVAGVVVPTGMWDANGNFEPEGNPDVLELGTVQETANAIKIDWDAIVNGGAITPDAVLPGDPWPSFSDPNYWPIVYVDQVSEFSLNNIGRGILIVRNDLAIGGNDKWDGIVLVGGKVTADGSNTVRGTVISGLNVKLGETVGESAIGNGTKTYVYHSCNVENAMQGFASLRLIPNTWSDNWPGW